MIPYRVLSFENTGLSDFSSILDLAVRGHGAKKLGGAGKCGC